MWGEECPEIYIKYFSRTRNAPGTLRERNRMIFSKEKQTIVSFWRFFQETKEKLENIVLMLSSSNPFQFQRSAAKRT